MWILSWHLVLVAFVLRATLFARKCNLSCVTECMMHLRYVHTTYKFRAFGPSRTLLLVVMVVVVAAVTVANDVVGGVVVVVLVVVLVAVTVAVVVDVVLAAAYYY